MGFIFRGGLVSTVSGTAIIIPVIQLPSCKRSNFKSDLSLEAGGGWAWLKWPSLVAASYCGFYDSSWTRPVVSKGTSSEWANHTHLCFSIMPGLLGETSPMIQWSHTQVHTGGGGGLHVRCKQNKLLEWSPGHWQTLQMERRALVSNLVATVAARVWWNGSPVGLLSVGMWYNQARALDSWSSELVLFFWFFFSFFKFLKIYWSILEREEGREKHWLVASRTCFSWG